MPRPRKPEPPEITDNADDAAFAHVGETLNQLAVMHTEADNHARQMARQVGYLLPADSTDPDLIQRDIAANMRRSVESCLEVGKGLLVLKAACGHGKFKERLDVLSLDDRVARRFMSAARKFSNRALTPDLTRAIGSQTKLFELLVLDDDQVQDLAEDGETAGITLDDVERMSVKELRAALRESRETGQAKDRLLAQKGERIDRLQTDKDQLERRIAKVPTDEALGQLQAEATRILADARGCIQGALRAALQALEAQSSSAGNAAFMAGLVAQIKADAEALRREFALPDIEANNDLDWLDLPAAQAVGASAGDPQ